MLKSLVAISAGASLGAVCRWLLGIVLNPVHPHLPLGTLTANILGGYAIGLALSFFASLPSLSPEWRLFVVTGFLGALTTFSTFSAEVGLMLQQQKFLLAAGTIALHVCGSLAALFLGMGTFSLLKHMLPNG